MKYIIIIIVTCVSLLSKFFILQQGLSAPYSGSGDKLSTRQTALEHRQPYHQLHDDDHHKKPTDDYTMLFQRLSGVLSFCNLLLSLQYLS